MNGVLLSAIIALTNEFGSAEIDTLGALVRSYIPRGGQEVLFRQSGKRKPDSWYNGGVPVCWPWFNREGDPGTVMHGFARLKEWKLVSRKDGAAESQAVFRLEESDNYQLDYEVVLGKSLALKLVMRNTGKERFVVTTGLHPYFAVSDPANVTVVVPGRTKTLAGRAGMDGGLPYGEGTYEVFDKGTGRRLDIEMSGNNKLILWNIGPGGKMAGMADDDWRRYLCIEPAVIPRADGFYLNPGETRTIGMTCTVTDHGSLAAGNETPYAFRARLEQVHEPNRRDPSLQPAADEFVFCDGMKVGDCDFSDYLNVSMGIRATATHGDAVVSEIDNALHTREYVIDVRKGSVAIRASDERTLQQAYYHLEDLMNLRRAPFLKIGTERRRMRFSPRMIHSGYACDIFPDNYLKLIAHHGFDAIVFYIKDVDKTAAGPNQNVNSMIERARGAGLDTYLYSSVSCFAHPDDPMGRAEIEASFGRVAKAHPGAKGIVFVGESCQFPSKDPRVQPVRHENINHDDPRPLAGWFPCRDYPDWLRAVMDVLHQYSPKMEIVFWTYNWSRQDAKLCAELIPHFPDGVAIQGTLGNGAVTKHDNGLVCICRDYTVSTPGFTDHYAAQARAAKAANRRFYTMANTAGLTWDYGVAPYLPCPFQWKKRWDGLVDPQYGISGLMETHHFGWYPSFISELAKEAYTEGGMDFDEHVRKIAARDFGEANADRIVDAWKKWSRTEVDYVANNENQYGPFRIGPAFPYNFGGKKILHSEFPQDTRAYHTMRWMAILNFPFDLDQAHEQNIAFVELNDDYRLKQLELFERMRRDFADGGAILRTAAATLTGARRAKAEEMIGVGEWHQRTVETAINLNRGYLAFKRGDQAEVLKYARAEYANAEAALKLAERDSRLGWEPSMEYAAGPKQIRWKLSLMRQLYGAALKP